MLIADTDEGRENSRNPAHWENMDNMDSASREYLEKSLRYVSPHPDESNKDTLDSITRKNDVRKAVKGFFSQRDCQVLFRPVNDESKLREVNKMPYDELRI